MKKSILMFALSTLLLTACGGSGNDPEPEPEPGPWRTYEKVESDSLYAKKVIEKDSDFIMGMDVSSVLAEEASGVKFYNFKGEEADLFEVLSENGVNYIRVRIWNNPYDDEGHGFGGGNNDLAAAIKIGKRATANKMKLLVDFHYSDFWADPAKQQAPRAWQGMDIDTKANALYQYTLDSLNEMKKEGIDVGMVQVGNETNNAKMAGASSWFQFQKLFAAGSKGVREAYPDALVAVHFANPEKNGMYKDWASKMDYYELDYDVFGTSYYPWWHGTLENLSDTLSFIAETYDKKTMVLETSYAWDYQDTDFGGNTSPKDGDVKPYPITVAGQANHVNILADTIANKTKNGIGICYWEGAWITVGDKWEDNHAKWEQYGSGWAASYAGIYDKDVAEYGEGGSQVENQAFFDKDGKPLESLKMFNLVRFGNDAPKYVDGTEDAQMIKYTTDEFELPETVNVIFNDNSRNAVPVVWDDFDIEAAKAQGNGRHVIEGTIQGGGKVTLTLTLMEYNFLENYSFEDGKPTKSDGSELESTPWEIINRSETPFSGTYVVKVTNENVLTGSHNLNFWAQTKDTLNFDLEQKVTAELETGTYKFQASLMGEPKGDVANLNIYTYAKINGEIVATAPGLISEYKAWHDSLLDNIPYEKGQELIVGVHVECSNAGVWGSIEDCMLNIKL